MFKTTFWMLIISAITFSSFALEKKGKEENSNERESFAQYFSTRPAKTLNIKSLDGLPLGYENYNLILKKEFLERPFLMGVGMISNAPVAFGHTLASKIVYFKQRGDKLYLFESLEGHVLSGSVETKKLLLTFEIIEQSNNEVVFDFGEGMNRLFYASEMFISDRSGDTRPQEIPLEIVSSYMNKILIDHDYLMMNQFVQARFPSNNGFKETPIELKISFRNYIENSQFKAKDSDRQKKVGYFEVHPQFEPGSGRSFIPIMKFDMNKKITYYLSSNIPTKFRQAVADGVTYWNQAFGTDVIEVKDLPKGISTHHPGLNIVQWMDYDKAGFAYADIQADPRTGEILGAHVYMTSTFALAGATRARNLLVRLNQESNQQLSAGKINEWSIGLKGLAIDHICQYRENNIILLRTAWNLMREGSIDQEALERFAQDYVRSVMAHEVGHTLGLRHNFAGSLASTLPSDNWHEIVNKYLKEGEVDEKWRTTSSVMEYSNGIESVLQGAHIRLKHPAAAYDKAAINWGYDLDNGGSDLWPLFCTDTHLGTYSDCLVWDSMSHSVEGTYWNWKNFIEDAPLQLATSYLSVKAPYDERDLGKTKIKDVGVFPKKHAFMAINSYLRSYLSTLDSGFKPIKINKQYPYLSSLNMDSYKEDVIDFQKMGLDRTGQLDKLVNKFRPKQVGKGNFELPITNEMREKYDEIIFSDYFLRGFDIEGEQNPFSAIEISFLHRIGEKYFPIFTNELLVQFLGLIGNFKYSEAVDALAFEESLGKLLLNILTAQRDDRFLQGQINEKSLKFNEYYFNKEIRISAANLLAKTDSLYPGLSDFLYDVKSNIKTKLLDRLKTLLPEDTKRIPDAINKLPRPFRNWAREEWTLISLF